MDHQEKKQLQMLKKKAPVERFLMMSRLIQDQYNAILAGIKYRYPEYSLKEQKECLKEKMSQIYSLKH